MALGYAVFLTGRRSRISGQVISIFPNFARGTSEFLTPPGWRVIRPTEARNWTSA